MANLNLNKVILAGRLTADVELRTVQNDVQVCSFTIAVNRSMSKDQKQEADFIGCVAWRKTAEFISRYFHKGSSLCVVGSIQTRTWTDQNGQKRYSTEVIVDEAKFVDSRNEQADTANHSGYVPDAYTVPQAGAFEELPHDDTLPF